MEFLTSSPRLRPPAAPWPAPGRAAADSFGGGSGDAAKITAWVKARFRPETIGGETVYDLASPVSSTAG